MDVDKLKENIDKWLSLNNSGLFVEAKDYYYNNLFEDIIEHFIMTTDVSNKCDVLFSVLGFSPEPIILTQRALMPTKHVIFTTNKDNATGSKENEIVAYLEKYLTSDYKIITLEDDSFDTIYKHMRAQMNLYPSNKYVVDITGGKKSMVASAAIFARDFNCNVVYVDYDQYNPDLRRPMPGTERLNVVYSYKRDLLADLDLSRLGGVIADVSNIDTAKTPMNNGGNKADNTKKKNKQASLDLEPTQEKFNDAFKYYVGERPLTASNPWKTKGISAVISGSKKSVKMSSGKKTVEIQRAQLWQFYNKFLNGDADINYFFVDMEHMVFNASIKNLLNLIHWEMTEEHIK